MAAAETHGVDDRHAGATQSLGSVLDAFLSSWSDDVDHDVRRIIAARAHGPAAAAGPEGDERRAWMCVDWLVRTYAPAWLAFAGVDQSAAALRLHDELTDTRSLDAALRTIGAVRAQVDSALEAVIGDHADAASEGACAAAYEIVRGECATGCDAVVDAAAAAGRGGPGRITCSSCLDAVWGAVALAALHLPLGARRTSAVELARCVACTEPDTTAAQHCARYADVREVVLTRLQPEFAFECRPVVVSLRESMRSLLSKLALVGADPDDSGGVDRWVRA